MANSFLDFLESMTIAMEADDITSETANEVRSALGGTPSTQTDIDTRRDEEDLQKVDDIFGTEKPEDGPSGDPEKDKAEGSEDIATIDDDNNESDMDTDTNLDSDTNTDLSTDNTEETSIDEPTDSSSNTDLLFTKKNAIRDNLAQLYTIINGDIEILVNSLTNINDSNTIKVLNAVLNHLRNCKDYIYKTLTVNLTSLEYDELLQRYVTLKRVYDICIEMMDRHFKKDSKK